MEKESSPSPLETVKPKEPGGDRSVSPPSTLRDSRNKMFAQTAVQKYQTN